MCFGYDECLVVYYNFMYIFAVCRQPFCSTPLIFLSKRSINELTQTVGKINSLNTFNLHKHGVF